MLWPASGPVLMCFPFFPWSFQASAHREVRPQSQNPQSPPGCQNLLTVSFSWKLTWSHIPRLQATLSHGNATFLAQERKPWLEQRGETEGNSESQTERSWVGPLPTTNPRLLSGPSKSCLTLLTSCWEDTLLRKQMEGVRKTTPHLGLLGYLSTAHSLCLSTSITPHELESLCQSTFCFLPSHCPAALPCLSLPCPLPRRPCSLGCWTLLPPSCCPAFASPC